MGCGSTILGVGAYIPEQIRTNDWWPADLVKEWERRTVINLQQSRDEAPDSLHPVLREELDKIKGDPFGGTRERRVAGDGVLPSDMELAACREALEDAKVRPEDVDLVMTFSLPTDTLILPNMFKLHHELGLKNARGFGVSAICHSFMTMMDVAHHYISAGTVRNVLLCASTKYSDLMDYTSTMSVAAGDGAAAAVMGPCPEGRGVRVSKHFTDSVFHESMIMVCRAPARPRTNPYPWGPREALERPYFTCWDPKLSRDIVASVPVWAERLRTVLFDEGPLKASEIDLLATNAAFCWYAPVMARILGIPLERVEDNVSSYSNMGAVNLPMNLYHAVRKGRLHDGDKLLLVGHGGGASYGAIVLDWVG
jgi:3-oxoacyl-[acyl-carrier-protein] synthase-3